MSEPDFGPIEEEDGEEQQDPRMKTVKVINVSSQTMRFELDGIKHVLKPRYTATVRESYTLKRKFDPQRDPVASVISLLTNGAVVRIDDKRAKGVTPVN